MDSMDRRKLLDAGFKVFRTRKTFPIAGSTRKVKHEIWALSPQGSWFLWEQYDSGAQMKRAKQIWSKDPKSIFDEASE